MLEETSALFHFPPINANQIPDSDAMADRVLIVLPLTDTVLFPHMFVSVFLTDPVANRAVERAMADDRTVLAILQRDLDFDAPRLRDLYTIGVEATIQRLRKMPDGSTSVMIVGRRRMRIVEPLDESPLLRVRAEPLLIDEQRTLAVEAMMRAVLSLYEKITKLSRTLPDDAYVAAMNVDAPGGLADLIASTLPISSTNRQQILETVDPEERLHRVMQLLTQELDLLELENRIQSQVQKEVDRSQREIFLREQLKMIQRELGQDDPAHREVNSLRSRLVAAGLPEYARHRVDDELARLEAMPTMSPEYSILRTYLDWMASLPWAHVTDDQTDLREAAKVLDRNHFGLQKVKERIIEFIAVRQLVGSDQKAPILCFVGPPGVGKTSLGQSIAEVLGRRFVRLALGGVHDEAEIRGHRRTYIGAMPGRIVQRLKESGTLNPVFMLDEVDKLGADFRGDPSSALLEVLDPEQNHAFSDHYLDLPFDLSRTLFIATANVAHDIPDPLLDRMEVIDLPGYTEEEKLQIAYRFLIPKQMKANGLAGLNIHFSDSALRSIIRGYTYEAGVRNLEREIGSVCRKIARQVAEQRPPLQLVTTRAVERMLGPPRFEISVAEEQDQVGVATGMVYTGNGGDTMPIECSLMEGKGALMLTGQLGDIMQESAQAALSYIRAHAAELGIDGKRFEKVDIHIHVPEGATPKDGPSAGITIATALISALTGRTVRRDVAMTGEMTLRGRVLPIGGVKEKVLGAYRSGVRQVILPRKNQRDLVEIPIAVRQKLAFTFVGQIEEVLDLVLGPPPPKPDPKRRVVK
ncbi:ATP-dependent protease La [Oscillochloris trichoides DG-6]|uniref:Lon protease n=1 Tax=Oscillochloris trichoides DG-6 TaxID=765420 RepID=E1IGT8_9CHLR|nr:endopeptidase La [Oscillochloris trichoides]EFO79614.1 ATP-dependent protease La [Oscillochloris trichoides DG-6]